MYVTRVFKTMDVRTLVFAARGRPHRRRRVWCRRRVTVARDGWVDDNNITNADLVLFMDFKGIFTAELWGVEVDPFFALFFNFFFFTDV